MSTSVSRIWPSSPTDFILESKFECDQSNHSHGTKVRSESTQRQVEVVRHSASSKLLRDGNRMRGSLHGHRDQHVVRDDFFTSQGVSLTGNGDSLVSDGVCKHHTKPTHTSYSRTRDFSRVAQDLSHRVAPSLLFPSHLSTTSLFTCTPDRPSIRPSTRFIDDIFTWRYTW